MDERQIISVMILLRIIMHGIISIGACLYAIPLCCIRQFHKPLHLLTLNICIAVIICSTFWAIYEIMDAYYPLLFWSPQTCLPLIYLQNMFVCLVNYAFCVVSLNRLFTVIYKNKPLFRTKKWAAICVCVQWIIAIAMPLPILFSKSDYCLITGLEFNYRIYTLVIAVIIPALCLAITNTSIFMYAYRSTRRVIPMNEDSARLATLSQRDSRLLKHMMFMFAVFFGSLAPIFIIMVINGIVVIVSPLVVRVFVLLPAIGLLIDVIDLFFYNHELRKYLTNRRVMEGSTQTREHTVAWK